MIVNYGSDSKIDALLQREPTPETCDVIARLSMAVWRWEQRRAQLLGLDSPAKIALGAESKFTLSDVRAITDMLDERERRQQEAATAAALKVVEVEVEADATPVVEPVPPERRLGLSDLELARSMVDGTDTKPSG